MFGVGMHELLIILVIVLIFFGGKRLPLIGKGLGQSIREFREATGQVSGSDVIDIEKVEEPEREAPSPALLEESTASAASSPSRSARQEAAQIPGVQEAKKIREAGKKMKKLSGLLKKRF